MPSIVEDIVAAKPRIADRLGDSWSEFESRLNRLLEQIAAANPEAEQLLVDELLDLGLNSSAADLFREIMRREQSAAALGDEAAWERLGTDLASVVAEMGGRLGDPSVSAAQALQFITKSDDQHLRKITLNEAGIGGGKSVKPRNLHLSLNEMSGLALGVIASTQNVVKEPNGLVVAAGVLLIIRSLTEAMTVKISEKDASVFWGLIQAGGRSNTANEKSIAEQTNRARKIVGLLPLSEEEIRYALHTLKALKSVEVVEGKRNTWRIIENYKIKD